MWDNVFLEFQLAKGFLKAAIRSKHIHFTEPQNDQEAQIIKNLKIDINCSRSDRASLYYGLIFDKVILNAMAFRGNYLSESDQEGYYKTRPIFTKLSPEYKDFVASTMPQPQQIPKIYDMPSRDKANLFAMCEPLIWQSWKATHPDMITRPILRDILDFMAVKPECMQAIRDDMMKDNVSLSFWRHELSPLGIKYRLDEETIRYFLATFNLTYTKGFGAASRILEAQRLKAALPVQNLTFGKGRFRSDRGQLAAVKDDYIVAGVRLFLEQIDHFPVIQTFDDVLRVRSHKEFSTFRSILQRWLSTFTSGDVTEEKKLRSELKASNIALRRAVACEAIGRYFVYISLPLVVLDMLIAPVFGTSLTLTGFGIQTYADWQKARHSWLMIGNDRK